MEKTSKVTKVVGNGSWDSKYGTMYKFEIEFENGDSGDYNSKTVDQSNFVEGKEASYEITSRDYNGRVFYTIKPIRMQQALNFVPKNDPDKDKKIARMSVLKVASDLVINGEIKLMHITHVASILEHYVNTGEDAMAKIYGSTQKKPIGNIEGNFQEDAIKHMEDMQRDDLPF